MQIKQLKEMVADLKAAAKINTNIQGDVIINVTLSYNPETNGKAECGSAGCVATELNAVASDTPDEDYQITTREVRMDEVPMWLRAQALENLAERLKDASSEACGEWSAKEILRIADELRSIAKYS